MKKAYDVLAKFYDNLQKDIDYDIWLNWFLKETDNNNSILEIGCGTGLLANKLSESNFIVDAFDLSPAMIEEAKKTKSNVKFYVDNMITFKSNKKYSRIICFMDTINYLTEEIFIKSSFESISKALLDDGVFYFDIHQETNLYNFDGYMESGYVNQDFYRWNSYIVDEENGLVNHDFSFLVDGEKFTERHTQKIKFYKYYEELFSEYFSIKNMWADEYRVYFELIKK